MSQGLEAELLRGTSRSPLSSLHKVGPLSTSNWVAGDEMSPLGSKLGTIGI